MNACAAKIIGKNDCAETHLFSSQRYKYSLYSVVSTVLMSLKEITGSIS